MSAVSRPSLRLSRSSAARSLRRSALAEYDAKMLRRSAGMEARLDACASRGPAREESLSSHAAEIERALELAHVQDAPAPSQLDREWELRLNTPDMVAKGVVSTSSLRGLGPQAGRKGLRCGWRRSFAASCAPRTASSLSSASAPSRRTASLRLDGSASSAFAPLSTMTSSTSETASRSWRLQCVRMPSSRTCPQPMPLAPPSLSLAVGSGVVERQVYPVSRREEGRCEACGASPGAPRKWCSRNVRRCVAAPPSYSASSPTSTARTPFTLTLSAGDGGRRSLWWRAGPSSATPHRSGSKWHRGVVRC